MSDLIDNTNCDPTIDIEVYQYNDYTHTLHSKATAISNHAQSALNMIKHSSATVQKRAEHIEMLSQINDLAKRLIESSLKM